MIVYGKNVVRELLDNNKNIEECYVYEQFNDKNLLFDLQKRNIKINYCTKKELDKIANGVHQGIIVSIPDYQFHELEELFSYLEDNSFVVMLDHIEDPHNFGAIIRTCEAAGIKNIIIPKDRSVGINATVMKVSAGALENVRIFSVTNLNNAITKLKEKGYWIVGTTMDAETSYMELDYDMSTCLIIGNEGSGISRLVREACDYLVSIPMKGKVNSLNASVAAGIVIYGVLEKRRK